MSTTRDRRPRRVRPVAWLHANLGFGGGERVLLEQVRAREPHLPVLLLTARGQIADKLAGFRLGADDYVTKPFKLPELIARVEGMLRRSRKRLSAPPPIVFGEIEIDVDGRRVRRGGREVALLAKEFDLLCALACHPGRPLSRETILERVWGWDFDGTTRTVDNYILALRQKLEQDSFQQDPSKARQLQQPLLRSPGSGEGDTGAGLPGGLS